MSQVRLLAHAAPPGSVDLWLGIADVEGPPTLSWTVDGEACEPEVLRPLQAVRQGDAAPAAGGPRMVTGGFRIPATGPVDVQVACEAGTARLRTRPVPTELPEDRWFNVLLASCFDRNQERAPLLANRTVRRICEDPDTRPDLALFMGDQVYLDVPPTDVIGRFGEPGLAGITAQFEDDYRLNWMVHLADVLAAAPLACVPDDHEFWNNYPVQVAWLPRTMSARGRVEWEQAARRCYDAFQRNVAGSDPQVIDVGPVSFFVMDTRTWRTLARDRAALPEHLDQLATWARAVKAAGRWGVFVTGQTLFKAPVGDLKGRLTDYELANYGDYKDILRILRELSTVARPAFCLTGDVHFGRVAQAHDADGHPRLYEIISSPLALCSDPRSAHQPMLSVMLQRMLGDAWVGVNRPWPRHPVPQVPPMSLPTGEKAQHVQVATRYTHMGNQVAMLGLRRKGAGLRVRIGYWTLHPDKRYAEPVWVGPFDPTQGIDVLGPLHLPAAGLRDPV